MSRNKLLALSVVAVVAVAVAGAGAALASSSSDEVIRGAWVSQSGYIIITVDEDSGADFLTISEANPTQTVENGVQIPHGQSNIVLPPISDKRVSFQPIDEDDWSVSLQGFVVPDSHPDTNIALLRPANYTISVFADGELVDTEEINLTLEATTNYLAEHR